MSSKEFTAKKFTFLHQVNQNPGLRPSDLAVCLELSRYFTESHRQLRTPDQDHHHVRVHQSLLVQPWFRGPWSLPPALARLPPRPVSLSGLSISIRDPSRFAVERSEIASELRRLAKHKEGARC